VAWQPANHVQPVIRYRLGDCVVLDAEPCACARALPTIRLEGRTDEILRVPRTGGREVALLPMAVATVIEETPGVRRYQVLQTAPSTLTVRLETDPGVDRTDRAEVWLRVRARLAALLQARTPPGWHSSSPGRARRPTHAAESSDTCRACCRGMRDPRR
jgi:phenylacetate-CoA ligase